MNAAGGTSLRWCGECCWGHLSEVCGDRCWEHLSEVVWLVLLGAPL